MFAAVVFMLICAFGNLNLSDTSASCSTDKTTPVKVFLTSRQNQTGHWISQMELQQNGVRGQPGSSLEFEHSANSCTGAESSLNVLLTITAPPPRVGSDYEFFAGFGYYKFHNIAKTFEEARQICAYEGAHLAVINSEMESKIMKTLFSRFSEIAGSQKHLAWIGVQRIGDNHFSILGPALKDTGFARWSPGEPNMGGEYCVTINRGNGGLLDIGCQYNGAFICEQYLKT